MKFIVKGKLENVADSEIERGLFNIGILSDGKILGNAPLDGNGSYNLVIDGESIPPTVEVALYPSSVIPTESGTMALKRLIPESQFINSGSAQNSKELTLNFSLPKSYIDIIKKRIQSYHVHGKVFTQFPTYFEPLAGCRIDFYEVDTFKDLPSLPGGKKIPGFFLSDDYLGSAYTNTNGDYDFRFKFGRLWNRKESIKARETEFSPFKPLLQDINIGFDAQPDIRARFFQFINGTWTKIFDAPMTSFDWNISTDFHRDYTIPSAEVIPSVGNGIPPATGFRFNSIGLLPVDTTRIVNGYAYAQPGDPCGTFSCHPFCDHLRIYGLFASSLAVTTYTIETLKTDSTGTAAPTETWKSIQNSLTNLEWNNSTNRWELRTLGPIGGPFRNVDILPEGNWLEHALKIVWNTHNYVDGYYKLRITGFNASNVPMGSQELPMIRIDNSMPDASFDISSPSSSVCGDVILDSSRKIKCVVTAYNPQGHLDNYQVSASRGRIAESAGATVVIPRPTPTTVWNGVINGLVSFPIADRVGATISCVTMAYNFHLRVQYLGTNGYTIDLPQRRIWKEMNLVVTEPST